MVGKELVSLEGFGIGIMLVSFQVLGILLCNEEWLKMSRIAWIVTWPEFVNM